VSVPLETRTFQAVWIFDLVDGYLKELHGSQAHPRPGSHLFFDVVGKADENGDIVPLPVTRRLVTTVNRSGYHLWFGEERLHDGARRRLVLEPGCYDVRVRSFLYQELPLKVALPMPDGQPTAPSPPDRCLDFEGVLSPSSQYPFPAAACYRAEDDGGVCGASARPVVAGATRLRGVLLTPSGQGMQRAEVKVDGTSNTYRVGADGQWVLWFPPDDASITGLHTVSIKPLEGPPLTVDAVCVVHGHETSLPATALRGHVLVNGRGAPGTEVSLAGFAETVKTQSDGSWWYYFLPNQQEETIVITVTLPDGRRLSEEETVKSRRTVVVPSFRF
jgi:hypothetical protein